MLGEGSVPKFMVHRSMILEFVTECALRSDCDVRSLTVHDLLVGSQSAAVFRHTFAVVGRSADMDQALVAMNDDPRMSGRVRDGDGTAQTAVVGWLTNTMYTSEL